MLSLTDIRKKISPICQSYGVKKCFLFGSYARGEAYEHSDIDLRIEPGKINSLFLLSGFYTDVKESLNKDIDIISDLPDNQNFCDNLHKEEILLYDA